MLHKKRILRSVKIKSNQFLGNGMALAFRTFLILSFISRKRSQAPSDTMENDIKFSDLFRLAQKHGYSKNALYQLLHRLEKKGLVYSKVRKGLPPVKFVGLTEAGNKEVKKRMGALSAFFETKNSQEDDAQDSQSSNGKPKRDAFRKGEDEVTMDGRKISLSDDITAILWEFVEDLAGCGLVSEQRKKVRDLVNERERGLMGLFSEYYPFEW